MSTPLPESFAFTLAPGVGAEFTQMLATNSMDPYSACATRYLQRWATLMESQLSEGKSLQDIAEKTSHEADTEGITGFMYGLTVSILAKYWIHGDQLRRWHNKEYNYDGDGTVNPAVINLE